MILIFGANGQLGYEFKRVLKNREVLAFSHKEVDITDIEKIERIVKNKKIDVIINCAAYNNVDKAEEEKEKCYRVNAYAPAELAKIAKKIGAEFITYSTDFVFDGKNIDSYKENDIPKPISIYGKSKLEGERLVKEIYDRSYIIRVSWVYGVGNRNFIKNIVKWSKERNVLKMSSDQISSITYTKTIVDLTLKLLETKKYGLYHISDKGESSKYLQAKEVLKFLDWKGKLLEVSSKEFVSIAKRPKYSKLNTDKIEKLLEIRIPCWKENLKEFLLELKERGEL